jgi:hypothetical protein
MTVSKVLEAVRYLNSRYGYGVVHSAQVLPDGDIEFEVHEFGMLTRVRKGRLVNGSTVKALGHQKALGPHDRLKVTGLGYEALRNVWDTRT